MGYREFFFRLRLVEHLHRKRCDDIITEAGLFYGQMPILDALHRLGTASQKELAQMLHVSAPSIANSVKRLAKNGYIDCEVCEQDKRSHRLTLTVKGEERRQYCALHFDALDEQVMSVLSIEEKAMLDQILNKMVDQLKYMEKEEKKRD